MAPDPAIASVPQPGISTIITATPRIRLKQTRKINAYFGAKHNHETRDVSNKDMYNNTITILKTAMKHIDFTYAIINMDNSCQIGTLFYVCQLNGFYGCCSVDPCSNTDGCPDTQVTSFVQTAIQSTKTSRSISPQRTSTQRIASNQPWIATTLSHSIATSVSTAPTKESSSQGSPPLRHDLAIGIGLGVGSFIVLSLVCGYMLWRKYARGVARRLDNTNSQTNTIPGSTTPISCTKTYR